MTRILFMPFQFKKWLLLGFCAFLAQCGEGGVNGQGWSQGGNSGSPGQGDQIESWISQNQGPFILILAALIFLIIGLILLVTWLRSRGAFMLIDGIVKNRGAVREPWREYRREGNSLFLFNLFIAVVFIIAFLLLAAVPILIALPDMHAETFGVAATVAVIIAVLLLLLYILAATFVAYFLRVLVVPTMYLKRVRAMEGWGIAWRELGRGHIGSMILFFLMLFILGMAAGIFILLLTCLTCCMTLVPYVSSVLLLPVTVFFTSYVLEYIQQHGDGWQFFPRVCKGCGYDLRGHDATGVCPECGKSLQEVVAG